jgi:CRP/FNR family transcriptional regulator
MIPAGMLAALPLFERASPDVIRALASRGMEVHFPADAVLFLAGSEPRGWFIVVEGSVRVVRGAGPRQHVIHTETRGGTLGEVPMLTERPHPATAIASEPTRCVRYDRASLEAAIAEAPAIAFLFAHRLALRVERLVERLHDRSTASVQERLVEYLLSRTPSRGADTISLGMTQLRLAEDLGTAREVVSRELGTLSKRGWIEPAGGGRYRILDRDAMTGYLVR